MKRTITAILGAALATALLPASAAQARLAPDRFFGIVPQTALTAADTATMRAGGIGSLRTPVDWSLVELSPGKYDWWLDGPVRLAALEGIEVLPYFYGSPGWFGPPPTRLPVADGAQRAAWVAFLQAAVQRYGPGGTFWAEHAPGSAEPLPPTPIRTWQIWNEENFFYFTTPASPQLYGRLLKTSAQAIKSVDRGAKVLIGGLYGQPRQRPPRAMPAADFLQRLYRIRGIERFFDGVSLHPYAAGQRALRRTVWQVREVMLANRERRTGIYITELGWGSEDNRCNVAFEVGLGGQARELRNAYGYLVSQRDSLNLRGVYWFSWKDAPADTAGGVCSFCDSVGFFRAGDDLRAKPAWHAFVRLTGGQARPPLGPG